MIWNPAATRFTSNWRPADARFIGIRTGDYGRKKVMRILTYLTNPWSLGDLDPRRWRRSPPYLNLHESLSMNHGRNHSCYLCPWAFVTGVHLDSKGFRPSSVDATRFIRDWRPIRWWPLDSLVIFAQGVEDGNGKRDRWKRQERMREKKWGINILSADLMFLWSHIVVWLILTTRWDQTAPWMRIPQR